MTTDGQAIGGPQSTSIPLPFRNSTMQGVLAELPQSRDYHRRINPHDDDHPKENLNHHLSAETNRSRGQGSRFVIGRILKALLRQLQIWTPELEDPTRTYSEALQWI
jgi:hypothetical protein